MNLQARRKKFIKDNNIPVNENVQRWIKTGEWLYNNCDLDDGIPHDGYPPAYNHWSLINSLRENNYAGLKISNSIRDKLGIPRIYGTIEDFENKVKYIQWVNGELDQI